MDLRDEYWPSPRQVGWKESPHLPWASWGTCARAREGHVGQAVSGQARKGNCPKVRTRGNAVFSNGPLSMRLKTQLLFYVKSVTGRDGYSWFCRLH